MLKKPRIKLKKILDAARGQNCTVNSPYCNYNPETTVACHFGEPGERGMAYKPDDTSVVFACSGCHDWLDGRVATRDEIVEKAKDWYWFRAMRRTWRILVEEGVLK